MSKLFQKFIDEAREGIEVKGEPISRVKATAIVDRFIESLIAHLEEMSDLRKSAPRTFTFRGLGTLSCRPRRRVKRNPETGEEIVTAVKSLRFRPCTDLAKRMKTQEILFDESEITPSLHFCQPKQNELH